MNESWKWRCLFTGKKKVFDKSWKKLCKHTEEAKHVPPTLSSEKEILLLLKMKLRWIRKTDVLFANWRTIENVNLFALDVANMYFRNIRTICASTVLSLLLNLILFSFVLIWVRLLFLRILLLLFKFSLIFIYFVDYLVFYSYSLFVQWKQHLLVII